MTGPAGAGRPPGTDGDGDRPDGMDDATVVSRGREPAVGVDDVTERRAPRADDATERRVRRAGDATERRVRRADVPAPRDDDDDADADDGDEGDDAVTALRRPAPGGVRRSERPAPDAPRTVPVTDAPRRSARIPERGLREAATARAAEPAFARRVAVVTPAAGVVDGVDVDRRLRASARRHLIVLLAVIAGLVVIASAGLVLLFSL